jgi:hypothetical protein
MHIITIQENTEYITGRPFHDDFTADYIYDNDRMNRLVESTVRLFRGNKITSLHTLFLLSLDSILYVSASQPFLILGMLKQIGFPKEGN